MQSGMKVFVALLSAVPFAAFADWSLLIAPANVQSELAAPGELEIRVTNNGADASPAMDLDAGAIAPLLPEYQIDLVSGSCGPWRDEMVLVIFPATRPFARIAIPAIAAGATLPCRYRFTARRANSQNFRLSFGPIDRPTAPKGLIQIGALTDLGVTAALIQSRLENGQTIERYRVSVRNYGNFDVTSHALSGCFDNFGTDIRMNFPGGCERLGSGNCFDYGFSFRAGPVLAGQRASCEIETPAGNRAFGTTRLLDGISRADGRALLDTVAANNGLRIIDEPMIQVPTLSWLGIMALIFGVALVKRHAQ